MNDEELKVERVKVIVDALKETLDGFVDQIRMECCPEDEDQVAHRLAHLRGHYPDGCIHKR